MKIICIGRNYVAHIRELKNEMPEEPIFFMKPDSALLRNNDPFYGTVYYRLNSSLRCLSEIFKITSVFELVLFPFFFVEIYRRPVRTFTYCSRLSNSSTNSISLSPTTRIVIFLYFNYDMKF